ncbi:hypothetical protein BJX99DRAFT_265879, partial [Aspergillus californicus]
MDPIESSSSPFPAQSTESSASLQRNSLEAITTEAEQHNSDLSNTMNIQSSPDTRTNTPLMSPPHQTPKSSDRSAADTLPVTFQSDPSRSEAFTSDGKDSPTTTPSLGLLNLPSDLLPIVTETAPLTISSEAPPIPSVLMGVDDMLSEIDMDTVSSLDWIMAPESDGVSRPVITSWNALSEMDTHSLGLAPTMTATSLAENLLTAETNIIVSIPTGWSIANQEVSLGQEAGSAAHIKPLQAQGSDQSLSTSYTHRLSHQQPATAAPTQAVDVSSRSWQGASVTRTPAKPLITPPSFSYDQVVYNGAPLSTITEGDTVLMGSSTPPVLNQDDGGRLLPPSSTPSSRSRNLAKTEEICDSGSSRTTPARPMEENRTTSTSINMVPEKPAVPTDTRTIPHGPEWRPSTTTTSDTATSSVDTDSILDQLQRAQPISRQSVGVATGTVSAGTAVFILTFVLHRFVYRWVGRRRTGVIWIGREPNTNT